ncbi:hypothetical protein [Streptomyces sp. NPDC087300]|uniref:hypothetical protein n=1 Tax=Streptomyces sp. NPDC087300 TaxID=3365780 RepID=UPI0037F807EC
MQHWAEPGTIDDLLHDARTAGHPDVTERLINTWTAKGLLDHPRQRPAQRGSLKAEHPASQRRLLLILLEQRRREPQPKLHSLAQVPLWLWLRSDDWVPTRQAHKALLTWLGRGRRSQQIARDGALDPLAPLPGLPATAPVRARLVRLVTRLSLASQLTPLEHSQLQSAVRAVLVPDDGSTRAEPPADQSRVTVDDVVAHAETVILGVQHLLRGRPSHQLMEQARALHRAAEAHRDTGPSGADDHVRPPADLLDVPGLQEQINGTGHQLLFRLGHILRRAHDFS